MSFKSLAQGLNMYLHETFSNTKSRYPREATKIIKFMDSISYSCKQNISKREIKMPKIYTKMVTQVNGVNRIFTLLKELKEKKLYEVECEGMVWYEIHYNSHDRIDREYNYLNALRTFNKPNRK